MRPALLLVPAVLATLVACGGVSSEEGGVDFVDGDQVDLMCPPAGPVRVRVPREAIVQAYLCDADGTRCGTLGHVLDGDVVEVSCVGSPGRLRRIRWAAPVR